MVMRVLCNACWRRELAATWACRGGAVVNTRTFIAPSPCHASIQAQVACTPVIHGEVLVVVRTSITRHPQCSGNRQTTRIAA